MLNCLRMNWARWWLIYNKIMNSPVAAKGCQGYLQAWLPEPSDFAMLVLLRKAQISLQNCKTSVPSAKLVLHKIHRAFNDYPLLLLQRQWSLNNWRTIPTEQFFLCYFDAKGPSQRLGFHEERAWSLFGIKPIEIKSSGIFHVIIISMFGLTSSFGLTCKIWTSRVVSRHPSSGRRYQLRHRDFVRICRRLSLED